MKIILAAWSRRGSLLAINLLFLMMWGFAGIGKVRSGMPGWFESKFGNTILAKFPGLTLTFWLLTASEVLAFALSVIALLRLEFFGRCRPTWLTAMLGWSLLVFVELAFGLFLLADPNGTVQIFTYFGVTLLALYFVKLDMTPVGPIVVQK